jgi:hypothetical protein
MKTEFQRFRPEDGRTLDMTPEGEFVAPPSGYRAGAQAPWSAAPWSARLLRAAVLVAVLGGMMIVAGLAIWLAVLMIPVVLIAGAVAYGAYRWRLWQMTRGR